MKIASKADQEQLQRGSQPVEEAPVCQVVKAAIIWKDLAFSKFDPALYSAS